MKIMLLVFGDTFSTQQSIFFFAFLASDSLNSQFLFFRGLRIAGLRMSYLHNEFKQMELGKCFFNVSDCKTDSILHYIDARSPRYNMFSVSSLNKMYERFA